MCYICYSASHLTASTHFAVRILLRKGGRYVFAQTLMMMVVRMMTRVMTIKMMTALHASALRGLELGLEIIM